jgi:hypothetical protein
MKLWYHIAQLNREIVVCLGTAELRERLATMSALRWAAVVKAAGIKPD